ncbi:DNA helicase-2 / ATP-dependent DNA helicase PcrA [Lachnospiraceae bacterium NE2001]|nr:DNA helicase-2 / ATP-dependent DNA helicase PcrA [Lachnospiraceae bacterium NE2001]
MIDFESMLEDMTLTDDQKAAIKCIDKDMEIIACAGAGKTKTVTLRIINLLAHGVSPANIVAITFTRKAAEELKSRIYAAGEEFLGSTTGFSEMYVGTIDSFCLKVLQDMVPEYNKFSVLDDVQSKIFIEKHNFKNDSVGLQGSVIDNAPNLNMYWGNPVNRLDKKITYYIELVSMLNQNAFSKEHVSNWSDDIKERLSKYNNALYENKLFDYSSLIRKMIELLDPDSEINDGEMNPIAAEIYDRVKYLTIDEYQDSNPSQEKLVELFNKYGDTNICIVGDADQTIYQFRGSDEKNILCFADKYGAEIFNLNQDFRSTEAVIDIADTVIKNNHIDDPDYKSMKRGKIEKSVLAYEDGDTVWKKFANYDEEATFIAERIVELKELDIPYSEMAVLFKNRKYLHYGTEKIDFQIVLTNKLRERDIPYVVEGMNALHITPEYNASIELFYYIRDYFCTLKKDPVDGVFKWEQKTDADFAIDQETSEDIFAYFEMNPEDEMSREEKARQNLVEAWEKVGEYYETPELISGLDEAIEYLKGLDFHHMNYGHEFNMQQIFQDFIGHLNVIKMENSEEAELVLYNLGKTSKVIADYEMLFFKDSPSFKLTQFFKHIDNVASGLYPQGIDDNAYIRTDAVKLMTIHQSKGLEFTAVFVPAMTKEIYNRDPFNKKANAVYGVVDAIDIMSNNRGSLWIPNYDVFGDSDEATRKLVYVAITRAKKYLYLTYSDIYGEDSQIASIYLLEAQQSDYLKEYDESVNYSADHLPPMSSDPIPMALNFSLLSNYYDCPYRFKLSNFYGFVQPFSEIQGYGKVLHEIMMHINRAWINGERPTVAELDKVAEDATYLPYANSDQINKAIQGAKKCAAAYVEQNEKDADKIVASEMEINIEMGHGVSVNGRIDLIKKVDADGSEKTAIVDYKSAGKDAEQCLNAEQLKIYAIGYENATGEKADYLEIYNLDHPDGSRNARDEVDQNMLDNVKAGILDAAENIRGNNLPKCKGDQCKNCYMKGLC